MSGMGDSVGVMRNVKVTEGFAQEERPCDELSLVRYPTPNVHLVYRWKENGIDHTLEIIVNSPTITIDDLSASLYMEPDDTGKVGAYDKSHKA